MDANVPADAAASADETPQIATQISDTPLPVRMRLERFRRQSNPGMALGRPGLPFLSPAALAMPVLGATALGVVGVRARRGARR